MALSNKAKAESIPISIFVNNRYEHRSFILIYFYYSIKNIFAFNCYVLSSTFITRFIFNCFQFVINRSVNLIQLAWNNNTILHPKWNTSQYLQREKNKTLLIVKLNQENYRMLFLVLKYQLYRKIHH